MLTCVRRADASACRVPAADGGRRDGREEVPRAAQETGAQMLTEPCAKRELARKQ